jgi:hypothetical protein
MIELIMLLIVQYEVEVCHQQLIQKTGLIESLVQYGESYIHEIIQKQPAHHDGIYQQ